MPFKPGEALRQDGVSLTPAELERFYALQTGRGFATDGGSGAGVDLR